jgi:formate dehydrogenase subunit gamma
MDATSADGALRLEAVYCLGHCAVGPSGMLDHQPLALLDAAKLDALLAPIMTADAKP